MQRSIAGIVRTPSAGVALTITTALLISTQADAQFGAAAPSSPPSTGGEIQLDRSPKNMLVFPYGVQKFDRRENIKAGDPITVLPGWSIVSQPGMVVANVEETPAIPGQAATLRRRWLAIEDNGMQAGDGLTSPYLTAPAAWTYAWSFRMQIAGAPASDADAPVLAIQHASFGQPQDAWGIRFLSGSAELFVNSLWGAETSLPLFDYVGETAPGQWIDVRMVADLTKNTLTAAVNGHDVGMVRARPLETTDVTRLRFSYHGSGAGNLMELMLDEVGVAFLNPVCIEDQTYDMTTEDDFDTLLVNGQQIDLGFEFGAELTISASGLNNGAAIFDSSPAGPNNPSQDPDLLIGQGNILILQTDDASNPAKVGDIYPRPNDDDDGGAFQFAFNRPCTPLSIDLVDVDAAANEGVVLVLTDFSALTRTYTVPADWTGDLTNAEPGVLTLDLQSLAAQAGFNSIATGAEDAGFDPNAVVSMTVTLGGSGALDNLHVIIPCVQMSFETQDDVTPVFTGTPLANGQDLSTPPEFGIEMSIASFGPNSGAAIFDSTPAGPNDPGPDNDLLVGLGNILILQNNLFATQSVAGIFDTPNDDTNGGDIVFNYPAPVHVHQLDLIDADEEEITGVTVVLLDNNGNERTFTVPPAWTRDLLNDGPPGFGTLDLDTLAPQPGFAAVATAVEDAGFDPDAVIQVTVTLGGAQALDNICHCP